MSRAQQGQVDATGAAENSTYTTGAQGDFNQAQGDIAKEQQGVDTYANQVGAFQANNPYVQGGAVQTAQNQQLADTAAGNAQAAGQALQSQASRTGQNAGGAIAATEKIAEDNARSQMGAAANATAERAGAGTSYTEAGLKGLQDVVGLQSGVTQQQGQLANQQGDLAAGALSEEEKAAQTPSFMDELGQGAIQAGDNFATGAGMAFCPAAGSLYRMADDTEQKVETLQVGEYLAGIDGDKCLIEEIQSGETATLLIQTEDGHRLICSRVHAFAMPIGGFTVAMHSMGKTVLTANSRSKIVRVEPHGVAEVFNVITDGSHTYCADGMWSLGVGEAERQVSMGVWNKVGERLEMQEAVSHGTL